MKNSLVKKSIFYFIGSISSKLIAAVMIPIYAFYVSVDSLGDYDYALTIMNLATPIAFIAIWEAILKYGLIKDNDLEKEKIISTSAVFVLGVLMLLGVFIIAIEIISLNTNINWTVTIIMTITFALTQIWQYYARILGYTKEFVKAGILSALVNFVLIFFLICIFNMQFVGLVVSYIVSQLVNVIYLETKIKIIKYINLKAFEKTILLKLLKYSAPLVLNLSAVWAISGFGKTIIRIYLGSSANGMFSFAQKFSMVISVLGSVISMALIEESIIKIKDKDIADFFSGVILKLIKSFMSICIIVIPCIAIFYNFLEGTKYKESLPLVPILLLYAVVMTMATNVGAMFQASGNTKTLFLTTLVGSIITVVLCFILVEHVGIVGVAVGQTIGGMSMLIMRWKKVQSIIDFRVKYMPISMLVLIFILSSYLSISLYWKYNFIVLLCSTIVVAYVNRTDIIKIWFNGAKLLSKKK